MSHDDDEDEGPKPQGRKARAKQAAEEAWRAFEGSLPPLDVGQFSGKREPREGATAQLLAACERVVAGVGLKDASILAGLAPSTLRTLDALHLAVVLGHDGRCDGIVTYDQRIIAAAGTLGIRTVSP